MQHQPSHPTSAVVLLTHHSITIRMMKKTVNIAAITIKLVASPASLKVLTELVTSS